MTQEDKKIITSRSMWKNTVWSKDESYCRY